MLASAALTKSNCSLRDLLIKRIETEAEHGQYSFSHPIKHYNEDTIHAAFTYLLKSGYTVGWNMTSSGSIKIEVAWREQEAQEIRKRQNSQNRQERLTLISKAFPVGSTEMYKEVIGAVPFKEMKCPSTCKACNGTGATSTTEDSRQSKKVPLRNPRKTSGIAIVEVAHFKRNKGQTKKDFEDSLRVPVRTTNVKKSGTLNAPKKTRAFT